jgi:hypothetical protein
MKFVDVTEHPDAELLEGVVLLRVDAPLMFYNAGQARRSIEALMRVERRLLMRRRKRMMRRLNSVSSTLSTMEEGGSGVGGAMGYILEMIGPAEEFDVIDDDEDGDEIVDEMVDSKEAGVKREANVAESSEVVVESLGVNEQRQTKWWDTLGGLRKRRGTKLTATPPISTGSLPRPMVGLIDADGDVPVMPVVEATLVSTPQRMSESSILPEDRRHQLTEEPVQIDGTPTAEATRPSAKPKSRDGIHTIVFDFKHCLDMVSSGHQLFFFFLLMNVAFIGRRRSLCPPTHLYAFSNPRHAHLLL